jgi:hypothetical protein
MKYLICYVCLSSLSLGCFNSQRENNFRKSTSVSVIADLTDKNKLKLWPESLPILKLFRCEGNPTASCRFNLTTISDKELNPSFSNYLADAQSLEHYNTTEDPQWRSRNIIAFYAAVKKNLDSFYHQFDTMTALDHSEVWATVSSELIRLSEDSAGNKYLIIYSDLMEKGVFNAYKDLNLAPEIIAQTLIDEHPLPKNISDVTVIFVYEPDSRESDKQFQKMLKVYKILLKGAKKIIVQANNNSFQI